MSEAVPKGFRGVDVTDSAPLDGWRLPVALLVVAALYFVSARVGLLLALEGTSASSVWPPAGIAFGFMLLWGRRVWPAVAVGAFLANLTSYLAVGEVDPATAIAVSTAIAAGNTGEAVLGHALLRHLLGDRRLFSDAGTVFWYVGVAAIMCMVASVVGVSAMVLAGATPADLAMDAWSTWWVGDVVGVLAIAPPLLLWWSSRHGGRPPVRPGVLEGASLGLLMLGLNLALFGGYLWADGVTRFPFLVLPLILWASLRYPPRWATLSGGVVASFAVWGTVSGAGLMVDGSVNAALGLLQLFVCVVATLSLLLSVMVAQRDRVRHALVQARDQLEDRVAERTRSLDEANRRLAQTMALQTAILQSANHIILSTDRSGRVLSINAAGERILGYTPEDLVGRQAHAIFQRDGEGRGESILAPQDRTLDEYEAVLVARGGQEVPTRVSWSRLADGEGAIDGFLLVATDLRERHRLERLKREFLAMVSHELRTPLASVKGVLGALDGGLLGELSSDADLMVDIAVRSTDRLHRLINDLLDVERMLAGTFEHNPRAVDPSEIITESVARVHAHAAAVGVEVVLEVVPGIPQRAHLDPPRVVQALAHVLDNAVSFSEPGSEVRLRAEAVDGYLCISVSDEGEGIPEAFQPRLFEPFAQADSSATREHGGVGLGLSIAWGVVERHGGWIEVESEPGSGSTFTVVLPTVEHEAVRAEIDEARRGRR